VVEGLDLDLAEGVEDADFILASGVEPEQTLDGLRPLAEAGVAKGIPVVCSNPDLVAVSRDALTMAPGAFAKLYRELGGEVHYVGKPNRPIYQACLDALPGVDPAAIVCVGDSLEHDIAGAAGVGLDSAFVTQASTPPSSRRTRADGAGRAAGRPSGAARGSTADVGGIAAGVVRLLRAEEGADDQAVMPAMTKPCIHLRPCIWPSRPVMRPSMPAILTSIPVSFVLIWAMSRLVSSAASRSATTRAAAVA
jgi:hypothetical protein